MGKMWLDWCDAADALRGHCVAGWRAGWRCRHTRQELIVEDWLDCDLDLCLCSGFVEKCLASGCMLLETEGN